MAITVGNTQSVTANGDPGAVTKPTGLTDGDVLITTMATDVAAGTPPSGFTTIGSATTAASERVTVAYKVVTTASGEPASYTWTGQSGRTSISITAFSGVDNTTPIDMAATTSVSTTPCSLSNTTVTNAALLLAMCVGDWSTAGMTVPASMTQLFNLGSPGRRVAGAYESQATAGATGTKSFTGSAGLSMAGILFALRPAGGPTTHALASTGTGQSTGSVNLLLAPGKLSATGTGQSAGSVNLNETLALSATGTGQSTGSVNVTIVGAATTWALSSTGTGQTAGSLAVREILALQSTGTGQTTGSLSLVIPQVPKALSSTGYTFTKGSLNLTGPTFRFSIPTHEEPFRLGVDMPKRPIEYYRLTYAKSLVKVGGTWTQIRTPSAESLVGLVEGVDFFRGGYVYEIDQQTSRSLVAAGYTTTPI